MTALGASQPALRLFKGASGSGLASLAEAPVLLCWAFVFLLGITGLILGSFEAAVLAGF